MSNDWVGLDEDMDGQQSFDEEQDVEYVGVLEDEDEDGSVLEPVRVPRRPVQRVAPVQSGVVAPPARNGVAAPRGGNGRKESLIYYPTDTGAQVALNAEALRNIKKSKLQDVGGKMAYRIQPGTYVMVVPGHDPRRMQPQGVGDIDPLLDQLARTGSALPTQQTRRQSEQRSGTGTTDWAAFATGLVGGLSELGVGIATTVTGAQQARREADLERLRLQQEAEASAAAREAAGTQARRQHEENMARIRQQRAELAELQRTEDAAARAAAATGPVVAAGGTSPVVWVVLALVGLGGIGGLIWFLSSKKKKEE